VKLISVRSRLERNQDKEKAKTTKAMKVATYNLQAVLPVPRGDVSVFYYQSKLNLYNFTMCELNSQVVECYIGHEGEGNRGANEIGSCVWKYLQKTANFVNDDDLEIVLYSGNCCGQQKYRFLISRYEYMDAIIHFKIKSITHSGVPRNFVRGGVQQIQLRTEGRENGDLGALAP
jgi:hypothetical protein